MKNLKRKIKQGFTLVELVVVIAVIAILSVISIASFANIANDAKKSNDITALSQLNLGLKVAETATGKKPENMNKALISLEENAGISNPEKFLKTSYKNFEFAYDMEVNRFVILDGNKITEHDNDLGYPATTEGIESRFWKIVTQVENNSEYSQYVVTTGKLANEVTIKSGLDLGNYFGTLSINYVNTGAAKTTIIRTNGGSLVIDDESEGTIYHYNKADSVKILECHTASYHEYGTVPFVEIAEGHIVFETGSDVSSIHVDTKYTDKSAGTKDVSTFGNVEISVATGAQMPEFSRDSVATIADDGTKVCTLDLAGEKNDVVLFQDGIYEQIKIVNTKDGARWVDTSDAKEATKTAADQLANNISGSKDTDYSIDNDTRELTIINEENAKITDGGNDGIVEVTNYAELTAAIEAKANYIKFKNNIVDIPDKDSVNVTCSTIFDGNGYKLTHEGGKAAGNFSVFVIKTDNINVKFMNLRIINPTYNGIWVFSANVNVAINNCTIDSWFNVVFKNVTNSNGWSENCTLSITNSTLSLNQTLTGTTNDALCLQIMGNNQKVVIKDSTFTASAFVPNAAGAIIGGNNWSTANTNNCEYILENCNINLFGNNTWFYYLDCEDEFDTSTVYVNKCKFSEMGGANTFVHPWSYNYPVSFDHCEFGFDVSGIQTSEGTYPVDLEFVQNSDGTWSGGEVK